MSYGAEKVSRFFSPDFTYLPKNRISFVDAPFANLSVKKENTLKYRHDVIKSISLLLTSFIAKISALQYEELRVFTNSTGLFYSYSYLVILEGKKPHFFKFVCIVLCYKEQLIRKETSRNFGRYKG